MTAWPAVAEAAIAAVLVSIMARAFFGAPPPRVDLVAAAAWMLAGLILLGTVLLSGPGAWHRRSNLRCDQHAIRHPRRARRSCGLRARRFSLPLRCVCSHDEGDSMSTTTLPAEIEVPDEFLPDLIRITTIQLEMEAAGIPDLSGELDDRATNDAAIAVVARLIRARVATAALRSITRS